jgi:hypothetical protein
MIAPLLFCALMLWLGTAGKFGIMGHNTIAMWLFVTGVMFVPAFAVACYYY